MPVKYHIAAGVDAGSARTRCLICVLEGGEMRFVGYGEAPGAGWSKGRITDQDALSESIQHAVTAAERDAQVSIDEVTAGLGGSTIYGADSRGVYEFSRPREVEPGDLTYAAELASRVRLEEGRVLLQVYPQDFTLDGRAGYRSPRGAVCSRLEANVHVVTASTQEHQNLVAAIHQAHLAVEETVFEAMAAAYACVRRHERARGVAVIDIGMHSTEMAVFEGESVLLASSIPVSGDHFTRDLAWGLCVSYDDAQRLKEEYGCALVGLTSDNALVEVPSPQGRAPRETKRRNLNEIMEARAEELFLFVRGELSRVGLEQSLIEGVILTGGGAMLNGMCDMAERVLNFQARNGLPLGIRDWPEQFNNPVWTTAAGLAMYSARLKLQRENKRRVPNLFGFARTGGR